MNFLKKIPIKYRGELHDVRLINFTVAMEEIKGKVPGSIKVRDFNGRAMISMVDVKLKKMRPVFLPSFLAFNYRHIAFRLLVNDSKYNNGANKGIFFLKSFTDKPLIITGGKLLTDYNLEPARIEETDRTVTLSQGKNYVKYIAGDRTPATNIELERIVGALDRAYAAAGDNISVTQIQREKWPIEVIDCTGFENTFFKTAQFEGAFQVFETIYYDWLPPKAIQQ